MTNTNSFFSAFMKRGLILFLICLSFFSVVVQSTIAQPFAYVTCSLTDEVVVINTATNTVIARVDVGSFPQGLAITPDGEYVYVANYNSNNVSIIETATNTIIATVGVNSKPFSIAITPDGAYAYVVNRYVYPEGGTVSVIETTTNTFIKEIFVGSAPHGIAITPDGTYAYVVNYSSQDVSVIDIATNTVVGSVGTGSAGIAITPDGAFGCVIDTWSVSVNIFETATNTIIANINVDPFPVNIAITPDGAYAYVTHDMGQDKVSVIDTATKSVVTTIDVGSEPYGIAITPDGDFTYVANNWPTPDSIVSVIENATNEVATNVNVGPGDTGPAFVAITPEIPQEISIDIKPFSRRNIIHLSKWGIVSVAILSTNDFDAPNEVDCASLTFGRTGDEQSLAYCHKWWHLDVNCDGLRDQVCYFWIRKTGFEVGDTEGILKGKTNDGKLIKGSDEVEIKEGWW